MAEVKKHLDQEARFKQLVLWIQDGCSGLPDHVDASVMWANEEIETLRGALVRILAERAEMIAEIRRLK